MYAFLRGNYNSQSTFFRIYIILQNGIPRLRTQARLMFKTFHKIYKCNARHIQGLLGLLSNHYSILRSITMNLCQESTKKFRVNTHTHIHTHTHTHIYIYRLIYIYIYIYIYCIYLYNIYNLILMSHFVYIIYIYINSIYSFILINHFVYIYIHIYI